MSNINMNFEQKQSICNKLDNKEILKSYFEEEERYHSAAFSSPVEEAITLSEIRRAGYSVSSDSIYKVY